MQCYKNRILLITGSADRQDLKKKDMAGETKKARGIGSGIGDGALKNESIGAEAAADWFTEGVKKKKKEKKRRRWGLLNQAVLLLATGANIINQPHCDSSLIADGCVIAGAGSLSVPIPTPTAPLAPSLTCSVGNTDSAAGLQQNMSVHCDFFFKVAVKARDLLASHPAL